jgi:iron complex transport system permease protein
VIAARRIAPARLAAALAAATVGLALGACLVGAVTLEPGQVLAAIGRGLGFDLDGARRDDVIVWTLRLPRIALALTAGAALAVAGTLMQALTRNPLAEPGLLGVSNGAAVAAVGFIVLGDPLVARAPAALVPFLVPVAAFLGALATTALILALARGRDGAGAATLVLIGVGVAAVSGAATGLLLFVADDAQLRSVTFWSMGSLGGARWLLVVPVAVAAAVTLAVAWRQAAALDRLLLGEAEARHTGVDVERLRRQAALAIALATGAVVAACGAIGFVGLLVPHVIRGLIGPRHRALVIVSAVAGGGLLVAADLVSRTVVAPAELPIGIVTALLGAPFLIAIARARGRS